MEHQDWKPIIIGKSVSSTKVSVPRMNISKQVDNLTKIPDKFTKEFIQEVISKRIAKGMNRKKLAESIGEALQTIDWFETGKCNYSGELVSKFKRLFGKFENHPKQVSGKLDE